MSDKLRTVVYVLAGLLILLVGFSVRACSKAATWERRATGAEKFVSDQRKVIKMLNDSLDDLSVKVAKRDTVLVHDSVRVAAVDRLHPIPVACLPNTLARDTLIANQRVQIADLKHTVRLDSIVRGTMQQSLDSLSTVLAARPSGILLRLPFLEIEKPAFAPFVGVDYRGKPTAGIGISLPIRIGAR